MAETIEEIAALIQSLKLDNELNNEDFSKILYDIRAKVAELHEYNEATEIVTAIQRTIDEKSLIDSEKLRELDSNLKQLKTKVDSSTELAALIGQVQTLSDNFKSGFNSVVNFANKDADTKNLLLDRMEDLEKAIKNGAMIETLRQRTDELVNGYENFISDSNLRHGNMVSTIVDLKNKIDDYSSKNNYVFGTIDHTIADTSDKISNLESTISSHLGNVNSKLYSLGDDMQRILNDGFDHLKYLSSNMSEAMNSSSLDMKTTMEVLKANISDFAEHLRDEFNHLNVDISDKIKQGNEVNSTINNDILNKVKEVENTINLRSDSYNNSLKENVNNITEFIEALQETISVFKTENTVFLSDKLTELNEKLHEINISYEKLIQTTTSELKNVSDNVVSTSENIVNRLQETDIEEIYTVKTELLSASASNLNMLIEKIQDIGNKVENFKEESSTNLSNYLVTVKDLFNELYSKVSIPQNDTELSEKLSNLEILMSRMNAEKNDNFSILQSILQKNSEKLESLGDLRNVIEEHSDKKDQKLEYIESLINKFDSEKNDSFSKLESLLGENTKAIEALNIKAGTNFGFEKLEDILRDSTEEKNDKLDSLKTLVNEYKESVNNLMNSVQTRSENEYNEISEIKTLIKDKIPQQSALEELSKLIDNKVFEYKSDLLNEVNSVKTSLEDISKSLVGLSPKFDESIITLKLSELNNQLSETTQSYEHALSLLSTRLDEYVESAENVSLTTNTKIDNTTKEFENVYERFENISEKLNTLIGDSGLIEILANIRQQFNVISEQLKTEKDGIISGVEESIADNINSISTAIIQLHQEIEEIHEKQLENFGGIIFNLEGIKGDTNTIYTNIEKSISDKFSVLASEFKPLGDAINALIDKDYTQIIEDIKQQIELSYVSLQSHIKNNPEAVTGFPKIEELYKSSINRFASMEEMFKSTIFDNMDSINSALVNIQALTQNNLSSIENVQSSFQEDLMNISNKIVQNQTEVKTSILEELSNLRNYIESNRDTQIEELRTTLLSAFDNDELYNTVRGINKSLADKITEFKQDSDLASQDIIDIVNSSKNTIDYILEVINNNFENVDNNTSKIIDDIETLNKKIDEIGLTINNSGVINAIESVNDKLNDIYNQNSVKQTSSNEMELKVIMAKIDAIAAATDDDEYLLDIDEIKLNVENLNRRFEALSFIEQNTQDINNKLNAVISEKNTDDIEKELKKIQAITENINTELSSMYNPEDLLNTISNKLDLYAKKDIDGGANCIKAANEDLSLIKEKLNSTETKLENYIRTMSDAIQVLTETDKNYKQISNNTEEIKVTILELQNSINNIDNAIEAISMSKSKNNNFDENKLNEIADCTKQINTKLDIVAQVDNEDVLSEIEQLKEQLSNTESNLESYSRSMDCKLDEISQFTTVNELITELNSKVDILAMTDDTDVIDEIYGIKQLIEDQINSLKSYVETNSRVQKLSDALNKIDTSISELDFSKQASEIKEAVITALVTVTNDISFVDEADEIKDYVDQRTNEIQRMLSDVKHQLYAITNTTDDMDMYSYTLQDVESDLAKLRLVVNEFADKKSDNELTVISANLNKMAKSMTDLRDAVVDAEIQRNAKNDITNIDEQLVSISSRLNKILLSKEEIDAQILEKLTETDSKTKNYNDEFVKLTSEIGKKLEHTTNIITVLKNSMMYLGEWMDGTTETLSSISDRCYLSDELNTIKTIIPTKEEISSIINSRDTEQQNLINIQNEKISEQIKINKNLTDDLNEQKEKFNQLETDIDNLQNIVENTIAQNESNAEELQSILENRISKQEKRLDRIEQTLDKIITIIEASGNSFETIDRINKLDEKVSKLNSNIEKLTAYVE